MDTTNSNNGSPSKKASNGTTPKNISYLMNTKNWWGPLTFIFVISLLGVGMIGWQTYQDAPPMARFISEKGDTVIAKANIVSGQKIFHQYALMEYGSFFGDGAQRGPDFTAEALHQVSIYMKEFYINQSTTEHGQAPNEMEIRIIAEQVKEELKSNRYDKKTDAVQLSDAEIYAVGQLKTYYTDIYIDKNGGTRFPPKGYISNREEVEHLSLFFFWGAWVCVTERPGSTFSYTHNWPFDPGAGNTPTSPVILWSVLGLLGFVLTCGIVLYFIGQYN